MWEITVLEMGLEMGAWDYDAAPAVDVVYGDDMRVIEVLEFDAVARTATVVIEFL